MIMEDPSSLDNSIDNAGTTSPGPISNDYEGIVHNSPAGSASDGGSAVELVTIRSLSEPQVKFIVQDETNTNWKSSRSFQSLPLSTSVDELYNAVAKEAGYVAGTFLLYWRKQDHYSGIEEEVDLDRYSTATLMEMQLPEDPKKAYLLIKEKDEQPPERDKNYGQSNTSEQSTTTSGEGVASTTSGEGVVSTRVSGASVSNNETNTNSSSWITYSNPAYNSSSYSSGYSTTYYYHQGKSETGFVGLVNQAMTCYLNSLLQTLYMTPEFRNAIYQWRFIPKEEGNEEAYRTESAKCIPHQLQRLFLQLQCSDKRAVETTDITTSFGWDGSEAWQQHDVQELCRVMFDALEKRFKKDQQAVKQVDLINELYQGKWKDYVRCKKCGHESSREDTFLDIPLVIKPFGMSITYKSVEEALEAFVEAETLEGDNQYFCERCNEKQDAQKGLEFMKFPYLLTLQLKRFDFDYSTMHRIKLNDRMTFPKVLNLNKFVESKPQTGESAKRYESFVVDKLSATKPASASQSIHHYATELPTYAEATGTASHSVAPDISRSSAVASSRSDIDELYDDVPTNDSTMATIGNDQETMADEHSEKEAEQRKSGGIPDMISQGPYVYELFSIMIHSGSAIGGHYYAYIKSLSDKNWYCFNDQSVSRITQEDIEQTFGGSERESKGYYSSMYSSSANAYMLMYRRISLDENQGFIAENDFPSHLSKEMELEKQKAVEKKRRQEMEKKMCKFKLFGNNFEEPGQIIEKKIEVHEETSFPEALQEAYKLLKYSGHVPLERCRLVKYDDYSETMDQSLDLDEFGSQTFGQVVGGARNYYSFELFLESRKENEQFKKYNKGGMKVKILLIDLNTGEVTPAIPPIRAEHGWTISEFKDHVGELFHLNPAHMTCVLEMYNDGRPMTNLKNTLRQEGLYRKHSVFVSADPYDCQKHYNDSLMCKHVEGYVNSILLNITLPPRQNQLSSLKGTEDKIMEVDEKIPDLVPASTVNGETENGRQDLMNDEISTSNITDSKPSDHNVTSDVEMVDTSEDQNQSDNESATATVGSDRPQDDNIDEGLGEDECSNEGTSVDNKNKEAQDEEKEKSDTVEEKDASLGKKRDIQLRVDRRTTISELKQKLEESVGVESIYFKLYRVYNNQQEYEMERLSDTLMSTPSESKIVVRLGRALQPGEHRVKLFLLRVNHSEYFKLMMESIVAKNTPIREFKKQIEAEAKTQGVECELRADRMRLRKKVWRTPGTVYLDDLLIDKDVYVYAGSEMFVEPLEDEEQMKTTTQMQLYVRRWRPSEYKLDPLQEVVLDTAKPDELRKRISALSGIPVDKISIAKGVGSFPADMSVLDVESDLDWDPAIKLISSSPFSMYDDGGVVYFKDSSERLADLSADKKNELRKSESSRLSKNSIQGTGSSSYSTSSYYRKEKALKIYTEDDAVDKNTRED